LNAGHAQALRDALAICTAKVPTPPEAPMIRTCWPGWTPPARRPCSAVTAASGTAAACSKVRLPGLGARLVVDLVEHVAVPLVRVACGVVPVEDRVHQAADGRIIPSGGFTRSGPGKPPDVTDAELVCLAVAQVLLRFDDERHWLRAAPGRVGHLFPT